MSPQNSYVEVIVEPESMCLTNSGTKQTKMSESLKQRKVYLQGTKEKGQFMIKRLKLSNGL